MNIKNIIQSVAEMLPRSARNDRPMIRQALNDTIDQAVRIGEMTERAANNWNQDRAVKEVQHLLTIKD